MLAVRGDPAGIYPSPVHTVVGRGPFATGSSRDSLVSTRRGSVSIAGSGGGNGYTSGIIDASPSCRDSMEADTFSSLDHREPAERVNDVIADDDEDDEAEEDDDCVFQYEIHETPI